MMYINAIMFVLGVALGFWLGLGIGINMGDK